MQRQEVSDICRGMLLDLVQGKEAELVNHPDYHLAVLSIKAQHIFQSDQVLPLLALWQVSSAQTAVARKHSRHFYATVISQPSNGKQFKVEDDFHSLSQSHRCKRSAFG